MRERLDREIDDASLCRLPPPASKPLTLSTSGAVFGMAMMVVTPAARRGAGGRAKVLLIGVAGITRVHMRIDEPGKDEPLRGIDNFPARSRCHTAQSQRSARLR